MFRKFINALKTSKAARFSLIAILLLMVVLCIPAAIIGIPIPVVIIPLFLLGFPVIIAVGGIGAAAGIAGSALSNKKSYDKISQNDPALAELEKERGKLQIYNIIFWVASIILTLVAAVLRLPVVLGIVLVMAVLIYLFKIVPMNSKFNRSFDDSVVRSEIDRRFANATYDAHRGFTLEEIEPISFLDYDVYTGYRYIEGDQGSVHFRSSRVLFDIIDTVVNYDNNDSTETRKTVFGGYLYSIPLSHPVTVPVYVASKKQKTVFKDKIETGSEDFDAKLKVYSSDPEAARQLLISQVKAQILRFCDFSKEPFCIVFNQDKLYVFVSGDSGFKVDLSKDIDVARLKEDVITHLSERADFINELEMISNSIL